MKTEADEKRLEDWMPKHRRLRLINQWKDGYMATLQLPDDTFEWVKLPDEIKLTLPEFQKYKGTGLESFYCADREATDNKVLRGLGDGLHEQMTEFTPQISLGVVNHSRNHFEWGYNGPGPAQLAFAILFDIFNDPELAKTHYQDFKTRFIANLPIEKWKISVEDVKQWIKNKEAGRLL